MEIERILAKPLCCYQTKSMPAILMVTVLGMSVVMHPAKPVIDQMPGNDQHYCKRQQP